MLLNLIEEPKQFRMEKPDDKRYICKVYNEEFVDVEKFIQHVENHIKTENTSKLSKMQRKVFECNFCEESFGKTMALTRHKKKVHQNLLTMELVCDICKKKLSSRNYLKLHKLINHNEMKYAKLSCDLCDKQFMYKSMLDHHKSSIHEGVKMWKKFKKIETFKPKKEQNCEKCNKSFKDLYQHVRKFHDRKESMKCETCGKVSIGF